MALKLNHRFLSVGAKVRMVEATDVPAWSKWDDDKGRTSSAVKRRLHTMFFQASRKVTAEVVYVPKEAEREALRHLGRVKIRVRDQSGAMVNITADPTRLVTLA